MSPNTEIAGEVELREFAARIRSRRTVNFFAPGAVPKQRILEAIEIARWAPNHRVTEPWKFFLLGVKARSSLIDIAVELAAEKKGPDAAEARRQRLEAVPGWLVVTSDVSDDTLRTREDYAATCCAMQNLMLYLWQAGIGVKWTTGPVTRDSRLLEVLGVDPKKHACVGVFWYGHPRIIPKQKRRSVDDILYETD